MKRGFSIFLLAIFLLNVLGYYGVFVGLQFKNIQELQARFDDDDYAREYEVTIKVPITIPYATDSRDYTRVDGEFEHQGEVYRMVKQKLQKDTLYIVCVKDLTSKDIKQALADYVKTFTDKPVNEKSQAKSLQNLIKDYIVTSTTLESTSDGWNHVLILFAKEIALRSLSIPLNSPPPKA
ncbi:MAG: hypothetical protein JNJ65_18825 [Cyclobacteriaceae bacterium]|nr:hypothetical protein [Cyclobacteriaceae bacterium]